MAPEINPKWIVLASEMLDAAADHYGNHGCNDWDYPARWTDAEREEFGRAVGRWNSNEADYDLAISPPDHCVMSFLSVYLLTVAGRMVRQNSASGGVVAGALARAVPMLRCATVSLTSIVDDLERLCKDGR